MSTAPLLVARGITLKRDGRLIVDHASLELEPAEAITISGPSGCGKSTLLRALATLIPITSGEISFEGRGPRALGVSAYRRCVSYVAQAPQMFEGSVADNVRAGPRLRGAELDDAKVAALLERVGLDRALNRQSASSVSGGERLRVALARALANEPRVLLLDEPTAALDPKAAVVVLDLLRALCREGVAIVVVTHVAEHASYLGGEAYRMERGVLTKEERAS